MGRQILIIFVLSCLYSCSTGGEGKVLVCYVMSWSVFRPAQGKFQMDDIDSHLCSHIIYGYRHLNSSTWRIESSDTWADYGEGNLNKLVVLKKENPNLKILTSLGGWNEGSIKYSEMVESNERRKIFIDSVLEHLQKHQLDGLDIDWQYPTKRGGKPEDKENFSTLLEELRKEFDKKDYTLTVRIMGSVYGSEGFDLLRVSQAVHYINLKSYSYHGTWESVTGSYSPLKSGDNGNVAFSVNYFLDEGVPKEKLLLGFTSVGNAFIMESAETNGTFMGRKAQGEFKGPWLAEDGIMAFYEICQVLTETANEWSEHWDESSYTPYIVKGNKFSSYDNVRSFEKKLEILHEKDLGGASLYSLDTDDFQGLCYHKKFILTQTIKNSLRNLVYESSIINIEYIRR